MANKKEFPLSGTLHDLYTPFQSSSEMSRWQAPDLGCLINRNSSLLRGSG
jgi:hypothetical protein